MILGGEFVEKTQKALESKHECGSNIGHEYIVSNKQVAETNVSINGIKCQW